MRIRIPQLLSQPIPTHSTEIVHEPLAVSPPRIRTGAVLSISKGRSWESIDRSARRCIASLKYETVEMEDIPMAAEDSLQKKYFVPLLEFWNDILFYQNNPFEPSRPIFTFWGDKLLDMPMFRLGFCSHPVLPEVTEKSFALLTLFVSPGMLDWEKFRVQAFNMEIGDLHYNLLGHLYVKMRRLDCSYALITDEHHALVVIQNRRLKLEIQLVDLSRCSLRQMICAMLMSLTVANDFRADWSGMPYLGACPKSPTVEGGSRQSYRDFDIFAMQRTPAIWENFLRWKEEIMRAPLLECGASLDIATIDLFKQGILHRWRSPYPIIPIPEETDSMVCRSLRPRNTAVDAILASQDATFTVTELARIGKKLFSQVIIGEIYSRSIGRTASVCLKLFDERYFPPSNPPNYAPKSDASANLMNLNCADDMVCREEGAYDRLRKYQGSMVPHFYGAHVFTMPGGWKCYGVLLEIIEGPAFAQLNPRKWCEDDKVDFTVWLRHALRVLAFSGIQQGDWHFSQVLCPLSLSAVRQHEYVLIDFAFAPQYLGDTSGTPPYGNSTIIPEAELAFDMGFGIKLVEKYWFEHVVEEQ